MTVIVNKILDRAERLWWMPLLAGILIGSGIGLTLNWIYYGPAWLLPLAAGFAVMLIRPLGTDVRRRHRIRQARRGLRTIKKRQAASRAAIERRLNELERRIRRASS